MSRIDVLGPEAVDDPAVAALLSEAETERYGDSAYYGAMAHRPALLRAVVSLFDRFPDSPGIEPHVLELMRLKVAEVSQCAYCATVRTQEVREQVAPKEAAVLGEEVDADALDPREYHAVRLARAVAEDPHRISDADFEEFRSVFADDELVELLLFACLEVGLDRFCIALTLDTTDRSHYPSGLSYPLEEATPRERRPEE